MAISGIMNEQSNGIDERGREIINHHFVDTETNPQRLSVIRLRYMNPSSDSHAYIKEFPRGWWEFYVFATVEGGFGLGSSDRFTDAAGGRVAFKKFMDMELASGEGIFFGGEDYFSEEARVGAIADYSERVRIERERIKKIDDAKEGSK